MHTPHDSQIQENGRHPQIPASCFPGIPDHTHRQVCRSGLQAKRLRHLRFLVSYKSPLTKAGGRNCIRRLTVHLRIALLQYLQTVRGIFSRRPTASSCLKTQFGGSAPCGLMRLPAGLAGVASATSICGNSIRAMRCIQGMLHCLFIVFARK